MKIIYSGVLLILLLGAQSVMAQDLGIARVAPDEYTEVKSGTIRNITLEFAVHGFVTSGTQFAVKYKIDNGATQLSNGSLTADGTAVGNRMLPVPCPVQFPAIKDDTVQLTIFIELGSDTNAMNDTIKRYYIMKEKVANDLQVTVLSPAPNSQIEVGTGVDVVLSLKNVGTNSLVPNDYALLRLVRINGTVAQQPQFDEYLGSEIVPGDSFQQTFRFVVDESFVGLTVELCNTIYWSEVTDSSINTVEGNYNDNDGCFTFNAIPSSIDEPQRTDFIKSVYYGNGSVNLLINPERATRNPFEVQVISVSGQIMAHERIQTVEHEARVAIPQLPDGVYVFRLTGRGGVMEVRKFLKAE